MAGYTRQSSFVDGDTITAALFNDEYNQLVNVFSNTSGHKHDGTAAEGPVIGLIGDAGETSPNNKVLIDTTNNYIEFYVEVSSAPVQQLYIADGAIIPVTDSDIDLGTTSLRFKDTYTDTVTTTGNVTVGGNLTVTGNATISGNLTFGDADTDSINLAAEIDSDIIPNTDGTYDLGSATKEWQDLYIDGTANIDSLVADTADINAGTIDNTVIGGTTAVAGSFTTATATTGNITTVNATTVDTTNIEVTNIKAKDGTSAGSIADSTGVVTLASSVLTTTDINGGTIDGVTIGGTTAGAVTFTDLSDGTITITAFVDEDNMASNSATLVPTQQSVKAYVDAQVTAQDLDFQGDSGGALSIDLDSETLTIAGGTGIDTSGATNTLTVSIDSTVATLTGTQTLTNKTLTSPVINTGVSGTAVLDDDTFATASATTLATSESIKAYVDTTVAATNEVVEDTTPQLGGNLDTNGNDILFGDNDKAIFGTGSDLQIYHDGSNSYISDVGTGDLIVQGSNAIRLRSATGENMGTFTANGAASLQYDNSTKLATTSTGIDVTGTAVVDGLTVDTNTLYVDSTNNRVGIGTTSPSEKLHVSEGKVLIDITSSVGSELTFQNKHVNQFSADKNYHEINFITSDVSSETTGGYVRIKAGQEVSGNNNSSYLGFWTAPNGGNVAEVMRITSSGNVGIGTTSPTSLLTVGSGGTANPASTVTFHNTAADEYRLKLTSASFNADGKWLGLGFGYSDNYMKAAIIAEAKDSNARTNLHFCLDGNANSNNAELADSKMTITYDGNVGIGTSSPATALDVTGTVTADGLTVDGGTGTVRLGNGDSTITNGDTIGKLEFYSSDSSTNSSGVTFEISNVSTDAAWDGGGNTHATYFYSYGDASTPVGTATAKTRLSIDNSTGDISFYEDTGTTAKLFWDASAEGLWLQGYGTSTTPSGTPSAINDAGLYFANNGGNARWALLPVETAFEDTLNLFSDVSNAWQPVISFSRTTQNVGIGTTSPNGLLETNTTSDNFTYLRSGDTSTAGIIFGNQSDAATASIQMLHSDNSLSIRGYNNVERLRIDSSGNVGIGTTSPIRALDVSGSTTSYSTIFIEDPATGTTGTGGGIGFRGDNGSGTTVLLSAIQGIKENSTAGDQSSALIFITKGGGGPYTLAEAMRIDSSGNVGIGTTSPSEELEISAAVPTIRLTDSDNSTYTNLLYNTGSFAIDIDATNAGGSSKFTIDIDGSERLLIDSSGNVGIGTSSPAAPLSIAGSSTGEYDALILRNGNGAASGQSTAIIFEASSGTSGDEAASVAKISGLRTGAGAKGDLLFHTTLAGVSSEAMRIDSSGNVIIANSTKGLNDTDEGILFSGALPGLSYFTRDGGLAGSFSRLNSYGDVIRIVANGNSAGRIGSGSAGALSFYNGAGTTENMRIDSSGNLLVGTTDISPATNNVEGIALRNEGHINVSRASGVVGYFNRKTNDGTILDFRKDGTSVGSIGTSSGSAYIGGYQNAGLYFNGTSDVRPWNTSTQANLDNSVDLGNSSARFKDLYLSGVAKVDSSAYISQGALTSSSGSVAWDAAAKANAYYATTENTTFAAPTNAVEGAIISVEIAQGSTAYTVAWNTVFEFAASTAPTVTATANKTDIFSFRYNGSVWQEIGRTQNLAQT